MHFDQFLREVPKAELHCHFSGTVRHSTLVELARRNGFVLPPSLEQAYSFTNFEELIDMIRVATQVFRTEEDFAQAAYEAMADGLADANVVHRELYLEVQYHMSQGVPFKVVMDGITAGLRAAKEDLGVTSRVIVAVDRQLSSGEDAVDIVRQTLAYEDELLAGIGLSGPEGAGPPQLFTDAFELAYREGLHRTNHVCEDNQPLALAPASHYAISRDLLHCERYDHGNNLVHDPIALRQAAADEASFAVVAFTSAESRRQRRWDSIHAMADAGLRLTINSDNPTMFGVSVSDSYNRIFDEFGWGVSEARTVVEESFHASWLSPAEKSAALSKVDEAFGALAKNLVAD
ncbi:adenosine deaminase family protein [Nocardia sp. NPDC055049]